MTDLTDRLTAYAARLREYGDERTMEAALIEEAIAENKRLLAARAAVIDFLNHFEEQGMDVCYDDPEVHKLREALCYDWPPPYLEAIKRATGGRDVE